MLSSLFFPAFPIAGVLPVQKVNLLSTDPWRSAQRQAYAKRAIDVSCYRYYMGFNGIIKNILPISISKGIPFMKLFPIPACLRHRTPLSYHRRLSNLPQATTRTGRRFVQYSSHQTQVAVEHLKCGLNLGLS